MGDYDEKSWNDDFWSAGFEPMSLVVIISLVRGFYYPHRKLEGISKLSVAIPQDIDPLDAPDWIVRMFPSWEINNVDIVSPQQALEFFDE